MALLRVYRPDAPHDPSQDRRCRRGNESNSPFGICNPLDVAHCCETFPFSFRISVNSGVSNCACARGAGLAIAAAGHVARIRAVGKLAVASSACVRTDLDRLQCGGFEHLVRAIVDSRVPQVSGKTLGGISQPRGRHDRA